MANPVNPHGFQPLGINLAGGNLSMEQFPKPASDALAIFRYDVVSKVAANVGISGTLTPGTTLISGVALDFGAASTATLHQVIISPDALYEAQANGVGCVTANMGLNANIITGAGDTTTKKSGHQIDASTVATTATLDLHLLRLYANVDNAFGVSSRIEVVINKHRMTGGVAGV